MKITVKELKGIYETSKYTVMLLGTAFLMVIIAAWMGHGSISLLYNNSVYPLTTLTTGVMPYLMIIIMVTVMAGMFIEAIIEIKKFVKKQDKK